MTVTDQALLERWYTHRDAEAFKTIAQRHAGMVYATCRRVLRNATDAEDVAQECFEVLCSTRQRPNRNLASWLHTVAVNRAINRIRAEKRKAERQSAYAMGKQGSVEIGWDDLYELVDEVIAELPQEMSEPVVRHFFENETHDEIARSLGVTRSAITHRIGRAVDRMRASLERRGVGIAGGALSILLAKNATAKAAPSALMINVAKLALAGPPATVAGAGFGMLAVKISALLAIVVMIGYVVSHVVTQTEPVLPTSTHVTEDTTPISENITDSTAQPQPTGSGASAFARAMSEALTGNGANAGAGVVTGRMYIVETGEPVSGIKVMLKPVNDNPDIEIVAATDDKGIYRLTVPAPGEYTLQRPFSDPGLPSPEDEPRTIRISQGQVLKDIDFPLVMGILVSGICVDEEGNPISGATVEGRDQDNYRSLESYITREDGRFALAGLVKTPHFTLEAETDAGLVSDLLGPRKLSDAGLSDVRLVLRPGASISGTVVDPRGAPLPGVKVSTDPVVHDVKRMVGRDVTETESGGQFTLTGLGSGTHRLFLRWPGGEQLYSPATGPENIELKLGDTVDGLRLVFDDPSLKGLTISGRVVDTKNAPIANAEVRVHGGNVTQFGQTDVQGAFLLGGFSDTSLTVYVEHAGQADAIIRDIPAGTSNLKMVMESTATLEGQVVDASTGRPISQFELVHLDEKTRFQTGERTRMRPQVDPEGHFRIENVAPGPVTVIANAEGYAESELTVDDVKPGETRSNLRIALSGGVTVTGTVQDPSGKPVANAYIIPGGVPNGMEPRLAAASQTNDDGQFTLENQPTTLNLLSVYHESYPLTNVAVNAHRDHSVTITLAQGCSLEGSVYVDGEPAAGVDVQLFFGGGIQRFSTRTSAEGTYHFGVLPAESGFALALPPLLLDDGTRIMRWLSQPIALTKDGPNVVDFVAPPISAVIEGTVTYQGAPYPGANMTLLVTTPFGTEQRNTNVSSDGAYRFDAIPAGHAKVTANVFDPALSATAEVEVADGEVGQADLVLAPEAQ